MQNNIKQLIKYLGIWNNSYKYLIGLIIFALLKEIAFGMNYNGSFREVIKLYTQESFSKHSVINHIFCYFTILILSLLIHYYYKRKPFLSNLHDINHQIKLIHSTGHKNVSLIYVYLLIFFWIIVEYLTEIYGVLKDLDF